MSSWIDTLRSAGSFVSTGHFTVDEAKAREKLGKFQLTDPSRFLLHFVAAAHCLGAFRFEVDLRQGFEIRLLGAQNQVPESLEEHLLISTSPWQRLAVAFNAVAAYPSASVEIEGPPEAPLSKIVIHGMNQADRNSALAHYRAHQAWTDMPLSLDGKLLPRKSFEASWRSCERELCGQKLQLSLASDLTSSELIVVHQGLPYRPKLPVLPIPLCALLQSDGRYTLDASLGELIEDSALIEALRSLGPGVLEETARDERVQEWIARAEFRRFCLLKLGQETRPGTALSALPLFFAYRDELVSLDEILAQPAGPIFYSRRKEAICPPDLFLLWIDSPTADTTLVTRLAKRLQDGSGELALREKAEANRRLFLAQAEENPILPEHTWLATGEVEGKGFHGLIGISPTAYGGEMRVLYQERKLSLDRVDSDFPFEAVVAFDETLLVRKDWTGPKACPVYEAAVAALREQAQALNAEIARTQGPLSEETRQFLIRHLSGKKLSMFRTTPLLHTLDAQLLSIHQIEGAMRSSEGLGFLRVPCDIPLDAAPRECWPNDTVLLLTDEERKLLESVFSKKMVAAQLVDIEKPLRSEIERFARKREPRLGIHELKKAFQAPGIRGELALSPDTGSLEVQVLKDGVAITKRNLPTLAGKGQAIVELSELKPTRKWRDFAAADPAWVMAQKVLWEQQVELLSSLLKSRMSGWESHFFNLLPDRVPGLREVPFLAAFPRPQSFQDLEKLQEIDYAAPASMENLSEHKGTVLWLDAPSLDRLQKLLPDAGWRDVTHQLEEERSLGDFRRTPKCKLFLEGKFLARRTLPAPLRGEVGIRDGYAGWREVQLLSGGRLVETVRDALPPGLSAIVESDDVKYDPRTRAAMRGEGFERVLALVREAADGFILAQNDAKLLPLKLIAQWMESFPSLLDFPCLPTLTSVLSLREFRDQGEQDGAYYYVDPGQAAAARLFYKGSSTIPLVLVVENLAPDFFKKFLGSLEPGSAYLKKCMAREEMRRAFEAMRTRMPPCYVQREFSEGRLGIPEDGVGRVLVEGGSTERILPYPIVGILDGTPREEQVTTLAGELYAEWAEQPRHSDSQRLALICFLSPNLSYLRGQGPEWVGRILKARCWPAQKRAWISLEQIASWATSEAAKGAFPYLAVAGSPQVECAFPLPVLETQEEVEFLRRFLGRKLAPVAVSTWLDYSVTQLPAKVLSWVFEHVTPAPIKAPRPKTKAERRALKGKPEARPAPVRAARKEQDPEARLLADLRRELALLAPSSARRFLTKEFDALKMGSFASESGDVIAWFKSRGIAGPPSWRGPDKKLHLNRNHAAVRYALEHRESDPGAVLQLLVYLVGEINHVYEQVTDADELLFLDRLEQNLLLSYPDGPQAE